VGYRVKKQVLKDGSTNFKVLYEWFDAEGRHNKGIPKDKWAPLGFHPEMTFEEAQSRMRQLNAQDRLHGHEKRRTKIQARLEKERTVENAYLPEADRTEFETQRLMIGAAPKTASYWKAAVKALCELQIDPSDWSDRPEAFFDYFAKRLYSPAYVQKLIPLLNKWGLFISKKHRRPFAPLPFPRGRARQRIADANRKKPRGTGNRKSTPLTPQALESQASELRPEHYNWLYLTVWFGLRPYEVNQLKRPQGEETWKLEELEDGTPVLWVYQNKLQSIAHEERWKPIPCFCKEQLIGLKILKSGLFKQPLSKTIRHHFGDRITGYGGRKGFARLMKSKGQPFEEVSVWLGHKSIERTYADYMDKQAVRFNKVA
jgi:integrase